MSDDQTRLTQAYKRASLGLAFAALLWTAAFLFGGLPSEEKAHWLIPIAIAALSVLFFSRYTKSKQSPD